MTPPSPPASGGARLEDVRYLAGGARGPADFFRDAIGGFFPEIFRRIFPQIFAEKFRAGEFALPNAGASGPLSTQSGRELPSMALGAVAPIRSFLGERERLSRRSFG